MNSKIYSAFLISLFLFLSTTGHIASAHDETKSAVVIQVSDKDSGKWNLALNNAKNVQKDLGADKVQIQIVVYGPGISMLKSDATIANRVSEAVKSGIKIVACENTMKNLKLKHEDMNPDISYVPAGVTELMKKQMAGWAYIRP